MSADSGSVRVVQWKHPHPRCPTCERLGAEYQRALESERELTIQEGRLEALIARYQTRLAVLVSRLRGTGHEP